MNSQTQSSEEPPKKSFVFLSCSLSDVACGSVVAKKPPVLSLAHPVPTSAPSAPLREPSSFFGPPSPSPSPSPPPLPSPLPALPHASPKRPLAKSQCPHTVRAFITRMTTSPTTTLHAQGTHCLAPRPPTRVPCPCGLRRSRRPALHCPPPQLPSLNLKTAVESGRLAEAVGPQAVAPSTPRTVRCASGCSQPPATSTSSRNTFPSNRRF
jgi:hypothetical protein